MTSQNVQGNTPQIYVGEIGEYYIKFGGQTNYPCLRSSQNPEGGCFIGSAASGANNRYLNNTGLGTSFYYIFGGPNSTFRPAGEDYYCWGQAQAKDMMNLANGTAYEFRQYALIPATAVIDIEQPVTSFGWFAGSNGTLYQEANRQTFNGFSDWVAGRASADQNCSGRSPWAVYQPEVYTSQTAWYEMFSSGGNGNGTYGVISNTPVWTTQMNTNDSGCSAYISSQPGSWNPRSGCEADFYGASNYHYMWQW
ncbi:MAG: hypothetical protein ACYDBS_06690, partial [Acidimicrobiales bacterium]